MCFHLSLVILLTLFSLAGIVYCNYEELLLKSKVDQFNDIDDRNIVQAIEAEISDISDKCSSKSVATVVALLELP